VNKSWHQDRKREEETFFWFVLFESCTNQKFIIIILRLML